MLLKQAKLRNFKNLESCFLTLSKVSKQSFGHQNIPRNQNYKFITEDVYFFTLKIPVGHQQL